MKHTGPFLTGRPQAFGGQDRNFGLRGLALATRFMSRLAYHRIHRIRASECKKKPFTTRLFGFHMLALQIPRLGSVLRGLSASGGTDAWPKPTLSTATAAPLAPSPRDGPRGRGGTEKPSLAQARSAYAVDVLPSSLCLDAIQVADPSTSASQS